MAELDEKKNEIYIGRYDFKSDDKEKLSFKKGEVLTVLEKDEENLWTVENESGLTGLAPISYIIKGINAKYRVVQNFQGGNQEDLPCTAGETVTVLYKNDGWCKARNESGQQGVIPLICLQKKRNCYHGHISRQSGDTLLRATEKDGSFLVRDSETITGAYSLSLFAQGIVKHYVISRDPETKELYIQTKGVDKVQTFADIYHLIETCVKLGKNNGMMCALKYPVPYTETDLYEAVKNGNTKRVEELLSDGNSPDGGQKLIPLIAAVENKDTKMIKILLDYGADPNREDVDGRTPLSKAIVEDNMEIMKLLLDRGATINHTTNSRCIYLKVGYGDETDNSGKITGMLLVEKDSMVASNYTPLLEAVNWNRINCLDYLLDRGADVNMCVNGQTPLMVAAIHENLEAMEILVKQGADVNLVNCNGETVLMKFMEQKLKKNNKITLFLLQNGADTNLIDNCSGSALMKTKDCWDVTQLLLYGADGSHITWCAKAFGNITHEDVLDWSYQNLNDLSLTNKIKCLEGDCEYKVLLLNNNSISILPNLSKFKALRVLNLANNEVEVINWLPCTLVHVDLTGNVRIFEGSENIVTTLHTLEKDCFQSEKQYIALKQALEVEVELNDGNGFYYSTLTPFLDQPPPEVFTSGYKAVLKYFQQANDSKLDRRYSQRLVLLGEIMSGKTSLTQTLMTGKPFLQKIDDRTQVVDVHVWKMSDTVECVVYDQGGHNIYVVTNNMFLSKKSFVLILHDICNISEISMEKTINVFRRCLHRIPDATVHFVLSHIDMLDNDEIIQGRQHFQTEINDFLDKEINEMKMNKRINTTENEKILSCYHRQKKGIKIFTVSSKTAEGVDELKKFLSELAMKKQISLPQIWQKYYEEMLSSEKNYWHLEDLNNSFEEKYSSFDSKTCLQYYHDCGLVMWISEHAILKNYIFHKVEFLVSLLKSLLHHNLEESLVWEGNLNLQAEFSKPALQKAVYRYANDGMLNPKLLSFLWSKYNLETKDEAALLHLLKVLDICLDEKDDEKKYLFIPYQVLKNPVPENFERVIMNSYNQTTLHLCCQFFNRIPLTFLEMLTVRMLNHTDKNLGKPYVWTNGLKVQLGRSHCLIYRQEHNIHIYVGGKILDLLVLWDVFRFTYTELCTVIQLFPGAMYYLFFKCRHCYIKGIKPVVEWLPEDVFPSHCMNIPHIICGDDYVPAAMVRFPGKDTGTIDAQIHIIQEFLTDHFLGQFHLAKNVMHPDPVITELFACGSIGQEEKARISACITTDEKVEWLVQNILLNENEECKHQFQKALCDTRYHTNIALSKVLSKSNDDPEKEEHVFLSSNEKEMIQKEFYKPFSDGIDVNDMADLIDILYSENIIDNHHYECLKSRNTRREKAEYILDNILLRGIYYTVERIREALLNIRQQHLAELLPLRASTSRNDDLALSDYAAEDEDVGYLLVQAKPSQSVTIDAKKDDVDVSDLSDSQQNIGQPQVKQKPTLSQEYSCKGKSISQAKPKVPRKPYTSTFHEKKDDTAVPNQQNTGRPQVKPKPNPQILTPSTNISTDAKKDDVDVSDLSDSQQNIGQPQVKQKPTLSQEYSCKGKSISQVKPKVPRKPYTSTFHEKKDDTAVPNQQNTGRPQVKPKPNPQILTPSTNISTDAKKDDVDVSGLSDSQQNIGQPQVKQKPTLSQEYSCKGKSISQVKPKVPRKPYTSTFHEKKDDTAVPNQQNTGRPQVKPKPNPQILTPSTNISTASTTQHCGLAPPDLDAGDKAAVDYILAQAKPPQLTSYLTKEEETSAHTSADL